MTEGSDERASPKRRSLGRDVWTATGAMASLARGLCVVRHVESEQVEITKVAWVLGEIAPRG